MTIDILVPPLSQTMDSLLLVKWNKNVGDPVTKGEVLFMVETDKATLEVESPGTGILHEILAEPNSEVKVKSKIGTIMTADEVRLAANPGPTPESGSMTFNTPAQPASSTARATVGEPGSDDRQNRIFASPRARKLAGQENLALASIQATGPRKMVVERDVRTVLEQNMSRPRLTPLAKRVADQAGVDLENLLQANPGRKRITRADVETVLSGQVAAIDLIQQIPEPDQPVPAEPGGSETDKRQRLTKIRRTIARRMQESHITTAPVTLTRNVDATELKHLRDQILDELRPQDPRPSFTDLLISIVARCLLRHPDLNGTFENDLLELSDEVHMNLAVDSDRGLVVPVIRSVQRKGLLELVRQRNDLVRRAQENTLTLDELETGTFTLTNLGPLGVDAFTPIINPPQIAILGVGRIHPAPAAFEGQIALREMMFLSLTFDHRIVDGAPAARLLQDIVSLIEKPHRVWL